MSFEEFRATRLRVPGGYTYLGTLTIEDGPDGYGHELTIANMIWREPDLEPLEERLFEWATDEGITPL